MPKSDAALAIEVKELIQKSQPKFKVVPKTKVWFHRLVGKVWNKYSTDFWTTIGWTAAWPKGKQNDWDTLGHEGVHVHQQLRWNKYLWGAGYICPQLLYLIFPVLALVFWNAWFFLLGVPLLLPLPSPVRGVSELTAYKLSVMIEVWLGHSAASVDARIERIINNNLAGPNYYWPWPFKSWLRKQFKSAVNAAILWENLVPSEVTLYGEYFNNIFKIIKGGDRLAPIKLRYV